MNLMVQMNQPFLATLMTYKTLLDKINVIVIDVEKIKLEKSSIRITNIDLDGYSLEHAPAEANCGGELLYIDSKKQPLLL